jgi:hypothetical protein
MPFFKIIDAQVDSPTTLMFVQAQDEEEALQTYSANRKKLGLSVDTKVRAVSA